MHIDGGCHCGHITFEAEVDPSAVSICHCTDCQNLTGSAFRVTVAAPKAGFRILTGQPKIYIKTAESGVKRAHGFCPECGTPLYGADPDNPTSVSIRLGCVKERAQLKPATQIWHHSAMPWLAGLATVPASGEQQAMLRPPAQ